MSGSPVYYDGKLLGAVSLRIGSFSPDAICGITPIELMLEINEFDQTRPADAKTPDRAAAAQRHPVDPGLVRQSSGGSLYLTPIQNPLTFSGFSEATLRDFSGVFEQLGLLAVQGGATVAASATPAANTAGALDRKSVV